MESKAKREGEAAAAGVDGNTAVVPITATLATATAAVACDTVTKPMQIHMQRPATADVQHHAALEQQSAAVQPQLPAPAPLHTSPSLCKSCSDASARLEALQVINHKCFLLLSAARSCLTPVHRRETLL